MADAVRADVRSARRLEDAAPGAVIFALGEVLDRVVRGRQHVGAAVPPGRGGQQLVGFLAQGLGHAARLAVGPDHAAVVQIDPSPFQRDDFRAPPGKLELQADRQRNDVVLQALGLDRVKVPKQLAHVLIADEVGSLAVWVHRDVAARVGAVRPVAPYLGQVEHLAHDAESAVRLGGLVRHLLHRPGHIRALHVLHLHATQEGHDAAVDYALIAPAGAGLVALLGVILHELHAQLGNGGGLACLGLGSTGVAAPAHLGQPFLGQGARLLDGQFSIQAQGGLAALASVCAVLEHEHLAARWCNLAQEAGHQGVPEFDGLRLGLCRIDCGLGELDFCHDDSSERPGFQGPHGSHGAGSRIRFQKAPAYVELA
ncbi:hypothetical protein SDC9_133608 [bioreactor metagenome]|uniref:Uncharacterized protein n=1 Tax=bioreactor metagenome TaxID=1076179 RepID=A0A645DBE1_9ZZZZ